MEDYYYLTGKNQNGPFLIEELKLKSLTIETLVWTDGMENWVKIKDLPELAEKIGFKRVPPPAPDTTNDVPKTEVNQKVVVVTEKIPNLTIEKLKPSNSALIWIIIWSTFHFFAFIFSYSGIDLFNTTSHRTEKFWPFLNIWEKEWDYDYGVYNTDFNGIFYSYDWSEFAFYVGGSFLILVIIKLSSKEKNSFL